VRSIPSRSRDVGSRPRSTAPGWSFVGESRDRQDSDRHAPPSGSRGGAAPGPLRRPDAVSGIGALRRAAPSLRRREVHVEHPLRQVPTGPKLLSASTRCRVLSGSPLAVTGPVRPLWGRLRSFGCESPSPVGAATCGASAPRGAGGFGRLPFGWLAIPRHLARACRPPESRGRLGGLAVGRPVPFSFGWPASGSRRVRVVSTPPRTVRRLRRTGCSSSEGAVSRTGARGFGPCLGGRLRPAPLGCGRVPRHWLHHGSRAVAGSSPAGGGRAEHLHGCTVCAPAPGLGVARWSSHSRAALVAARARGPCLRRPACRRPWMRSVAQRHRSRCQRGALSGVARCESPPWCVEGVAVRRCVRRAAPRCHAAGRATA